LRAKNVIFLVKWLKVTNFAENFGENKPFLRTTNIAAMQNLRVDILKGIRFQGTNCFESYRHMLPSSAETPDAIKSTFQIMRAKYQCTAM
jgi:hypothetical protein